MRQLILVLFCIGLCSAAVAGELTLTTVFDKTTFYRGEPVAIWIVADNGSADTMIISVMTGLAGASCEIVDEHGTVLPYVGIVLRHSGAVEESQVVRPGSRRVYAAMLDYSYSLHAAGTYTVTARVRAAKTLRPVDGKWMPSHGMESLGTIRSEPRVITITDINDPGVSIIKNCQSGWLGCINSHFVRHRGDPRGPRVQMTSPSILEPYIELARIQFQQRPHDLRQSRESFTRRFPQFDQPGLLWMTLAESANRDKLKELDLLLEDARNDPAVARHPALLVMERRRSQLLDELKESKPR